MLRRSTVSSLVSRNLSSVLLASSPQRFAARFSCSDTTTTDLVVVAPSGKNHHRASSSSSWRDRKTIRNLESKNRRLEDQLHSLKLQEQTQQAESHKMETACPYSAQRLADLWLKYQTQIHSGGALNHLPFFFQPKTDRWGAHPQRVKELCEQFKVAETDTLVRCSCCGLPIGEHPLDPPREVLVAKAKAEAAAAIAAHGSSSSSKELVETFRRKLDQVHSEVTKAHVEMVSLASTLQREQGKAASLSPSSSLAVDEELRSSLNRMQQDVSKMLEQQQQQQQQQEGKSVRWLQQPDGHVCAHAADIKSLKEKLLGAQNLNADLRCRLRGHLREKLLVRVELNSAQKEKADVEEQLAETRHKLSEAHAALKHWTNASNHGNVVMERKLAEAESKIKTLMGKSTAVYGAKERLNDLKAKIVYFVLSAVNGGISVAVVIGVLFGSVYIAFCACGAFFRWIFELCSSALGCFCFASRADGELEGRHPVEFDSANRNPTPISDRLSSVLSEKLRAVPVQLIAIASIVGAVLTSLRVAALIFVPVFGAF